MVAQLAITRPHDILKRALEHNIRHLIRIVLARVVCRLLRYLDRLDAPRGSSSISQHLSLYTPVERAEEKRCRVDGLSNRQMAMIREDDSFVVAESLGDSGAFVLLECDATMLEADRVVIVEAEKFVSHLVLRITSLSRTYRHAS